MNYEDFYEKCRHLIDWRLREWTDAFGSKSFSKWVSLQEIKPKKFEDMIYLRIHLRPMKCSAQITLQKNKL